MPKVEWNGIVFDSELERDYYKYLVNLYSKYEIIDFIYHPEQIPNLVGKRSYTPDFLVLYKDRIEIIETKGYNPYSKMIDDQIHNVMLSKSKEWLSGYIIRNLGNDTSRYEPNFLQWEEKATAMKVEYKKIKYLKAYGFVEWDFKNPNTIANKRKEKITELSSELKQLRQFQKDTIRYFSLHNKSKLTPAQKEFIAKYLNQFYKEED